MKTLIRKIGESWWVFVDYGTEVRSPDGKWFAYGKSNGAVLYVGKYYVRKSSAVRKARMIGNYCGEG